MPESQPSVSDVMRQLSILTSKFESSASQLQSLQEGMLHLQSQMGRLDRMEGNLSRLSTQNKEALQMVARASDSPSAYDISIHDLPQEHVLQPEHWKPEHYCSDNLRRQLLQRVEHEVRKLFGNSADPTAVPGDSIGLKDALDTIQSHLEACDELVKRGQAVSMKSITPAIENVIFLRYKHKWGSACRAPMERCSKKFADRVQGMTMLTTPLWSFTRTVRSLRAQCLYRRQKTAEGAGSLPVGEGEPAGAEVAVMHLRLLPRPSDGTPGPDDPCRGTAVREAVPWRK